MKRLLFLLFGIVTFMSISAQDFMYKDLYYQVLDEDAKTCIVVWNWDERSGDLVIPEKAIYNKKTYTVTEIIRDAFANGSWAVSSVTIPKSITTIGQDAFSSCTNLKAVHISDYAAWCEIDFGSGASNPYNISQSLYLNGKEMSETEISNIPEGTKKIGSNLFYGSKNIFNIKLPNTVTRIGKYAFGNSNLVSIDMSPSVAFIEKSAFIKCPRLRIVNISDYKAWCEIDFEDQYANPFVVATHLNLNGTQMTAEAMMQIPEGTKKIGSYLFYNCSDLTNVTFPNSITSIGAFAFYGCSGITTLNIPNSSLVSVGSSAFSGCAALKDVYISNYKAWCETDFETYDANPFSLSQSLTLNGVMMTGENFERIPEGTKKIGSYALYNNKLINELTIPNTVTEIGKYAISGCTNLKSISLPNALIEISDGTLYYCNALTSIVIPNSVTKIGNSAFCRCEALTGIVIPNSVTEIGESAFSGCNALTSIVIPNSVTKIGESAFRHCTALAEVKLSDSLTEIEPYTFCNCDALTEIRISNSVTAIGAYAFSFCDALTSVYISPSVTQIQNNAFMGCKSLKNVSMSDSIIEIGDYAFASCSSLTSFTIPSSVKSIGDDTFGFVVPDNPAGKFSDIYCYAPVPPQIGINCFTSQTYNTATLHVLKGKYIDYLSQSYWYRFQTIVDDLDPQDSSLENIGAEPNSSLRNVYNLQGIMLKQNATQEEIDALPAGVYIIAGKKVIVK